jgi:hypothetical protein
LVLGPRITGCRSDFVPGLVSSDHNVVASGKQKGDLCGTLKRDSLFGTSAGSGVPEAEPPLAVTQRVLGHSDPKLTARVYTHLGTEDLRACPAEPITALRAAMGLLNR